MSLVYGFELWKVGRLGLLPAAEIPEGWLSRLESLPGGSVGLASSEYCADGGLGIESGDRTHWPLWRVYCSGGTIRGSWDRDARRSFAYIKARGSSDGEKKGSAVDGCPDMNLIGACKGARLRGRKLISDGGGRVGRTLSCCICLIAKGAGTLRPPGLGGGFKRRGEGNRLQDGLSGRSCDVVL